MKKTAFYLLLCTVILFSCVHNNKKEADTVNGNETATENNICQVHNIKMNKDKVRISYGYPSDETFALYALMGEHFPNSDQPVNDGCVNSFDEPQYTERYICTECNAERDKFEEQIKAGN